MKLQSITVKNFRSFKKLEEIHIGSLATIIGQNDVGKSNILLALKTFFDNKSKIEDSEVYDGAPPNEDVVIEVTFTSLPEVIELEDGVDTTFQTEMLVDSAGFLRIRKTFPRGNLTKHKITLITNDFQDTGFSELPTLKEKNLNDRCAAENILVNQSGRGITNKSKRELLRAKANRQGIQLTKHEIDLSSTDALWKKINSILPNFELFETDTKLGVGETTFQSKFRPIVHEATKQPTVNTAKQTFIAEINKALQTEVGLIFDKLKQHTNAFTGLTAKPEFIWEKAVSFEINGKDQHGIDVSLEQRGSGMRRLLMVAFFQYLAEQKCENNDNFIFAIEEPENCLHPKLQRELIKSFWKLANNDCQIIVTSHSPVFAGASPVEDLALIVRKEGVAKGIQHPNLILEDVAEELGVEPSDQITGYNACVFVEGITDIEFLKTVATKLKDDNHLTHDFEDKKIGFIITGGENLKNWINLKAMKNLNRHFGVVVDSDRKRSSDNIPGKKLNWKQKCEKQGGIFFILKKREIENYLHTNAIQRAGLAATAFDDHTDMKKIFGDSVFKIVNHMTSNEILQRDAYSDGDNLHHELKEIIEQLLNLAELN